MSAIWHRTASKDSSGKSSAVTASTRGPETTDRGRDGIIPLKRCGWSSGGVGAQASSGRVAELTTALSLAADLCTGQPMEHGLRTCWLSLAASEELGLDAVARSCVYYVALLRFVGCTSDASETAVLAGGDDVALNAAMAPMFMAEPGESVRYFVRHLAEDLPVHRRVGRVVRAMADPGMERRSLSVRGGRSPGGTAGYGRVGLWGAGPCV